MSTENHELLRRYVVERSEPAFAALVQRHLDLVYSAALRQLGGDPHAAQDVTQAVFCDLARQAPRLLRHPSLAAWLYTATRYRAARARRDEQRRRHRELHAHAMNSPLQTTEPDPAWQELRPVLDDAMHALSATDREALLLRFFENRPLAEVGARLGLSENAARMRVERALGKLRAWLARRGVTTSAVALAACLTRHAVNAAPPELAGRVTRAALAAGAAGGGFLAGVQALWVTAKAPVLAGGAAAVVLLTTGLWLWGPRPVANVPEVSAVETSPAVADASSTGPAGAGPAGTTLAAAAAADPQAGAPLRLEIVTADTGKPVPNARIKSWRWEGETATDNTLWADRFGRCAVPVPRDSTTRLVLVSQCEGFADTWLEWRPELGESIPEQYTLRVARAVPLGGYVVDADGRPVAGAEVVFGNDPPRAREARPQTDNWSFVVTATTDAEGRWRIERIGEAALRTLSGHASHPEHLLSERVKGEDPVALTQLREGAYVFRLGRTVTARGLVVDPAGQPVAGARVHVGMLGVPWRETTTATDGTFEVAGCKPGRSLLSAEAAGFAPTSQQVELTADAGPFRLTLGPGRLLRLRVVDSYGAPVPQANVWLNNARRNMGLALSAGGGLPVVANFHRLTDAEGRVEWENAPDQEQSFDIQAKGYLRAYDVKLRPDGTEHVVVLRPALTIAGTVRDAASDEPVPSFRILAGRPLADEATGTTNVTWSSFDCFRLQFARGQFRHVFEEPVVAGDKEPAFVFKFEAEGYAPFVSRVVRVSEGLAQFDVRLQAAAARTVTVWLPDGRPAVNADIGLVVPGNPLTLVPGGCESDPMYVGSRLLMTDVHGQFQLPPDDTITRVVAAHPEGFAVVPAAALSTEPVIRLQPWGRLEGTWRSGDRPVAERELALDYWVLYEAGLKLDAKAYLVKTDREGRFEFPPVPPGRHQLKESRWEVEPRMATVAKVWILRPLFTVDIRPGETTTVTVGGGGHTVRARLRWPEGMSRQPDWGFVNILWKDSPVAPAAATYPASALTTAEPELQPAVVDVRNFPLEEKPDGSWVAEDVPAGRYVLKVSVSAPAFAGGPSRPTTATATITTTRPWSAPPFAGGPSRPLARTEVPVVVPDDPPGGVLDLGEILLTPVR